MKPASQLRQAVSDATGIPVDDLIGPVRTQSLCNARYVLALLAKQSNPWWSNGEIAVAMGKQDPTTGIHALKRAAHLMETDETFRDAMDRAKAALEK